MRSMNFPDPIMVSDILDELLELHFIHKRLYEGDSKIMHKIMMSMDEYWRHLYILYVYFDLIYRYAPCLFLFHFYKTVKSTSPIKRNKPGGRS